MFWEMKIFLKFGGKLKEKHNICAAFIVLNVFHTNGVSIIITHDQFI